MALTFDIDYTEQRNRLTNAFRLILAIPHLIVSSLWGYLAEFLAVIQWFIILFTGKRNDGIWKLTNSYLGYASRVSGYAALTYDQYPAFGTDPGTVPVRYELVPDPAPPNRLTNALRIIWAIPGILMTLVIGIAAYFVVIISWFAIVITGKQSRGMFDFVVKFLRLNARLQAYVLLLTDTAPKYE